MEFEPLECHVDDALDTLAGKWKPLILLHLMKQSPLRSSELLRRVPGLTHKMLSKTLKELEDDDLISRHSYPVIPPKVEYCLTPHGEALRPLIDQLHEWGKLHRQHIIAKWQTPSQDTPEV